MGKLEQTEKEDGKKHQRVSKIRVKNQFVAKLETSRVSKTRNQQAPEEICIILYDDMSFQRCASSEKRLARGQSFRKSEFVPNLSRKSQMRISDFQVIKKALAYDQHPTDFKKPTYHLSKHPSQWFMTCRTLPKIP